MIDTYVFLAPLFLLVIVGLLQFVGCHFVHGAAPVPNPPTFDPPPGGYNDPVSVSLASDSGTAIFYTTDGSAPTTASAKYGAPIALSSTTVLRAIASSDAGDQSDTATGKYYVGPVAWRQRAETTGGGGTATTPFASPLGAGNLVVVWIFYQSAAVRIASVTDGANAYASACPPTAMPNSPQFSQEIWYAFNVVPGATVVAVAFTGPVPVEVQVSAHEYTNAYQESDGPLADAPPPGTSGATGANVATGQVMSRGRLIFGAAIVRGTATPGPGFTQRSSLKSNVAEDMPIPVGGDGAAQPAQATFLNQSNQDWAAQMITVK
jgi:Chitobiase/beta-hexosaminidase C-terminal domain